MTTLNMQEQFDNVFSNVSIVFFGLAVMKLKGFWILKIDLGI